MPIHGEKLQTPSRKEKVIYGRHFEECIPEVVNILNAKKIFVIVSKSLETNTQAGTKLQELLGDKFVGKRVGVTSHTPLNEVLEISTSLISLNADLIITLGGGSITDAAKISLIAAANNVKTVDELLNFSAATQTINNQKESTISLICIPTSLSAGEYNAMSGAKHPHTGRKIMFFDPLSVPKFIIHDPYIIQTTPDWIYFSTGVRATDHAVETLSSLSSSFAADQIASSALPLLIDSLLKAKKNPLDVDARTNSQLASGLAIMPAVEHKIALGASHAIGRMLGSVCHVSHGHTSCVMLPNVMRYNYPVNSARQEKVKELLVGLQSVKDIIPNAENMQVADILQAIFKALGMPVTLKEVNVNESQYEAVAEATLKDIWAPTNPIPITTKEQVLEILKMAA